MRIAEYCMVDSVLQRSCVGRGGLWYVYTEAKMCLDAMATASHVIFAPAGQDGAARLADLGIRAIRVKVRVRTLVR